MSMVHEITSGTLRNKLPKRKGRGESSGHGKTSGRGNKGSKARVGTYIKPGYEGGQTQIFRRIPKRGFSNDNFERRFHVVNVRDLERFADGTTIDRDMLAEAGLVPDTKLPVKILGEGGLSKSLAVTASKYSRAAFKVIQDAGGAAKDLNGNLFVFAKLKKKFVDPKAPRVGRLPAVDAGIESINK